MADIDIQRKPPAGWLWGLLGLAVLAGLVFWLLSGVGRDRVTIVDEVPPVAEEPLSAVPEPTLPAEVQQFQARCAPPEPAAMGLEHQHTSECLMLLASGIETILPAEQRNAAEGELARARDAAQRLQESPANAINHSLMAREGFASIASALQQLQEQWYPQLAGQVEQLRQSAEAVDAGEPLLEQRQEVQQFFMRAGDVLTRLARG